MNKTIMLAVLVCFSLLSMGQNERNIKTSQTTGSKTENSARVSNLPYLESFETFNTTTYFASQFDNSNMWTTWSDAPGTAEDVYISNSQSLNGSNAMLVENATDLVFLPNGKDSAFTSGRYKVSVNLLVPEGNSGYFNFLQKFDGTNSLWACEFKFDEGMFTYRYNEEVSMPYAQSEWHNLTAYIDLDLDHCDLYFNDSLIAEFIWSVGTDNVITDDIYNKAWAAINFFAWAPDGLVSKAFYDDLKIEKVEIPEAPSDLVAIVENTNDVHLAWSAPKFMIPDSYIISKNGKLLVELTDTVYTEYNVYPAGFKYSVSAVYTNNGNSSEIVDSIFIDGGVPREFVLFEQLNAYGEPKMNPSNRGLKEVADISDNLAVIAYHIDEKYGNEFSTQRALNYYGREDYASIWANGELSHTSNGNVTGSFKEDYLSIYERMLAVPSVISMNVDVIAKPDGLYTAHIDLKEEFAYYDYNLKLRLALIKSNIEDENGYNGEMNFVCKEIDTLGVEILFVDSIQNHWIDFTIPESPHNYDLIAFVQHEATKTVVQAVEISLADSVTLNPSVSFSVNMNGLDAFDSTMDDVYLTGSHANWPEPGTEGSLLLSDDNGDLIYEGTLQVDPHQEIHYKYFFNTGWYNGEPIEEDDRVLMIADTNMAVYDVWGQIGIGSQYDFEFRINPQDIEGFDSQNDSIYVTGSFCDWAMPGEEGSVLIEDEVGLFDLRAIITLNNTQTIDYRYYVNAGWDNGESTTVSRRATIDNRRVIAFDQWEKESVTVDFNVNLQPNIHFDPVIDKVHIVGTFSDNEPTYGGTVIMSDFDQDMMYSARIMVPANEDIEYLYYDNEDWDGNEHIDGNRVLDIEYSDVKTSDTWGVGNIGVLFNVDMNNAQNFDPNIDDVYLTGNFCNWTEPGKEGSVQLIDEDGDGIYSSLVSVASNVDIEYKYFRNDGWSNGEPIAQDRVLEVTTSDVETNDVWGAFHINVLFNVDMRYSETLNADIDRVYITGSFCNWANPGDEGTILLHDYDGDLIYSASTSMIGNSEDIEYKYFINEGWDTGDLYVGEGQDGARIIQIGYYDLTINDTWGFNKVNVSFNVDMINARGFEPTENNVYLTGDYCNWNKPGYGASIMLTDDNNDGIYSGSLEIEKESGEITYRYYVDEGWDKADPFDGVGSNNGRLVYVENEDITLNDSWGYSELVDVELEFNVDMRNVNSFSFSMDRVYVTGSFIGWAVPGDENSLKLTDNDNDGIYSGTIELIENYGELQYRYFINSGWDGEEWSGTPHRSVNINGWGYKIDPPDVFGVYTGVEHDAMDELEVQPNPFNEKLIIENIRANTQIEIRNTLGQPVKKIITNNQSMVLNTNDLKKGIYILIIRDDQNNVRTERVVKH